MTDESHEARYFSTFLEMHAGLERQGPGSPATTKRALAEVGVLPDGARILDVGCGPGPATHVLLAETDADIVAVDLLPEMLDELRASLDDDGKKRVTVEQGDMGALELAPASFDLVWSEGAAYNIGPLVAAEAWRPLLKTGGHIAFTELCWTGDTQPEEAVAFWKDEYPTMFHRDAIVDGLNALGTYELTTTFKLPDSDWTDTYYDPLAERARDWLARFDDDSIEAEVARAELRESDIFRKYSDTYGYVFFILRAI